MEGEEGEPLITAAAAAAAAAAGEGKGRGAEEGNGAKEGRFMLGSPTFDDIGNGRLRCVETGHELPAKDAETYRWSRGCRKALVDAALAKKNPPLNMFKRDPHSNSKLICKLTGDVINKSEEHIWKHISGKRFLNKLQQKEAERMESARSEKDCKRSITIVNSVLDGTKKSKKGHEKGVSIAKELADNQGDTDGPNKPVANGSDHNEPGEAVADSINSDEPDFWIPPTGSRWDFDDGTDRWESCTSSGLEINDAAQRVSSDGANEEDSTAGNLSVRTKRIAIAVGPNRFASKKKIKKTPSRLTCD